MTTAPPPWRTLAVRKPHPRFPWTRSTAPGDQSDNHGYRNDRREALDQPEFRTATHDTAFVGTFADRLAPGLANAAAG